MKESQIQKMSYQQLLDLQQKIAAAIDAKRDTERAALKEKLQSMAERAGFRLTDLFGNGRERHPVKTAGIKYRHPENRSLVWTGRGRRPKWLTEAGGDIERFRVA
jgi:DNA-binding protein H-NS